MRAPVTGRAQSRDAACVLVGAAFAFTLAAASTPGLIAPALASLALALAAVVA